MATGEVVFDVNAGGYDADMWDDRALIRSWERAYKAASRYGSPHCNYIHAAIRKYLLILVRHMALRI